MDLQQIKEQCNYYLKEVFDIDDKFFLLEEVHKDSAVVSFIVEDFNEFTQQIGHKRIFKRVLFENDVPVGYEIYER